MAGLQDDDDFEEAMPTSAPVARAIGYAQPLSQQQQQQPQQAQQQQPPPPRQQAQQQPSISPSIGIAFDAAFPVSAFPASPATGKPQKSKQTLRKKPAAAKQPRQQKTPKKPPPPKKQKTPPLPPQSLPPATASTTGTTGTLTAGIPAPLVGGLSGGGLGSGLRGGLGGGGDGIGDGSRFNESGCSVGVGESGCGGEKSPGMDKSAGCGVGAGTGLSRAPPGLSRTLPAPATPTATTPIATTPRPSAPTTPRPSSPDLERCLRVLPAMQFPARTLGMRTLVDSGLEWLALAKAALVQDEGASGLDSAAPVSWEQTADDESLIPELTTSQAGWRL